MFRVLCSGLGVRLGLFRILGFGGNSKRWEFLFLVVVFEWGSRFSYLMFLLGSVCRRCLINVILNKGGVF